MDFKIVIVGVRMDEGKMEKDERVSNEVKGFS